MKLFSYQRAIGTWVKGLKPVVSTSLMVITGVGGSSPAGGGTYVGLSGSEIGTFITIVTGVPVIGFSKPGSKPLPEINGF